MELVAEVTVMICVAIVDEPERSAAVKVPGDGYVYGAWMAVAPQPVVAHPCTVNCTGWPLLKTPVFNTSPFCANMIWIDTLSGARPEVGVIEKVDVAAVVVVVVAVVVVAVVVVVVVAVEVPTTVITPDMPTPPTPP